MEYTLSIVNYVATGLNTGAARSGPDETCALQLNSQLEMKCGGRVRGKMYFVIIVN